MPPHHEDIPTYPLSHASRRKPRRWPLVLRFAKGAIHFEILLPVTLHAVFTAIIAFLHTTIDGSIGLPSGLIPSLSIVVGLMLVFRNQTSYDRFWTGRNNLTTILTSVRNLARSFLCLVPPPDRPFTAADRAATDRCVRALVALLYAVKHHLRAVWGSSFHPLNAARAAPTKARPHRSEASYFPSFPVSSQRGPADPAYRYGSITPARKSQLPSPRASPPHTPLPPEAPPLDYADLLPPRLPTLEARGVSLPLQLSYLLETHANRLQQAGHVSSPAASSLTTHISTLVSAFSTMETIRLTPLPVALLIHQKQVLALFGAVLPFAMVREMGWWAVPMVSLVTFTLYGIEGIGRQLEDPFGNAKNDIKMDDIVEDVRIEVTTLLEEWRKASSGDGDAAMGLFGDDIPSTCVESETGGTRDPL